MKTVRFTARILYYVTRMAAIIYLIVAVYALVVMLLSINGPASWLPISVQNERFEIYYPFTRIPFLLGDYNRYYLTINLLTIAFYGLFIWLLSGVFQAFKQDRLFSKKGFMQLSRFYRANLIIPLFILLLLVMLGPLRQEVQDILRITFLHLVIGVFAFFMAAIFKQGLELQEEQDLIF